MTRKCRHEFEKAAQAVKAATGRDIATPDNWAIWHAGWKRALACEMHKNKDETRLHEIRRLNAKIAEMEKANA